ncbi:uncharacterized protein LOC116302409 [Actinia tenebrosa]|uniref:Uncharacterized protein LOC116302409 n=1 Tax=Actinia tenebrosa TaxID=6105 RepID=A0A6P8ILA2_ACTTE|nr:uncharacterized protein LOC116302409 [Actinia tenebrosa]
MLIQNSTFFSESRKHKLKMNIQKSLLTILLFLFIVVEGNCLWCYECLSNISWLDCHRHMFKRKCNFSEKFCLKATRYADDKGNPEKTMVKLCTEKELCSGYECKKYNVECEVNCCDTDFCNGTGLLPRMNVFFIAMIVINTVFINTLRMFPLVG